MTLFNANSPDPAIQQIDPNKDYYTELVGEGKKFKDNQVLARSKVEADNFAIQLQRENAEMRKEIDTLTNEVRSRQSVEELLKKNLQTSNTQNTQNNQGTVNEDQNTAANLTPQDVEELLNKRDQVKSAEANLTTVRERLEKEWGPTFEVKLREVAKSFGIGTKFLDDVARTQPQVFFQLVGLNNTKETTSTGLPPRNVSTEALNATRGQKVERANSYYQNLRKTQGNAKFFSTGVQTEIFKRIQEIGEDAFYNN